MCAGEAHGLARVEARIISTQEGVCERALTVDKRDHVCVSEGAEDGELVEGEGAIARRVDCRAAKEARAQTQEREGTRVFGEKASAGQLTRYGFHGKL